MIVGVFAGSNSGVLTRRDRDRLRQAEVENLDLAGFRDRDVRRLEIPMDDARFVRGVEGIGELPRDVQRLRDRERPRGEPSGQGVALDELEHQRRLLAVLDHVIDRRDVRMVERGQRTRLALESRNGIGVGRNPRRHDLDRHVASEAHITRPVDFPHAAGSEQRDDLVAADPRAGL